MDFVLIWVDGNETNWRNEYNKYALHAKGDKREDRFRDWDNLQYWFRGIDKFAPWVDKIHFVTWGHYPKWLNLDAPKLNFVKHSDYIPSEYLPTFNSHTIELNLHRIEGLSEQFVYFNDDTFIVDKVSPELFFKEGLPCDMAKLEILQPDSEFNKIVFNNMLCINNHFNKWEVIKRNWTKWYNLKYGKHLLKSLMYLYPLSTFCGFEQYHLPQPFCKSTFYEVWDACFEELDRTCHSRFRNCDVDINQYVMRYWHLVEGDFSPSNIRKNGEGIGVSDALLEKAVELVQHHEKPLLCLNDVREIKNFDRVKKAILEAFDTILPDKSIFEI